MVSGFQCQARTATPGTSLPLRARDAARATPCGSLAQDEMPFFSFRHDRIRTDVQDAGRVSNTASVHSHLDDLLLHLRRSTDIGILQQEGAPCTALLAAAIALLALTSLPMSNNISTLTVGAVQHLDDHYASPSC